MRACGDGALLSGRAAAYLLELVRGPAPLPEVTAPTERRIEGIKTRRSRGRAQIEGMTHRGIPITTVAETLVDLSSVLSFDDLARACHEAGVRYGTTPAQVEAALARRPRRQGAGNLRRVVRGEARVTLSKLERRFLQLLRKESLPLPETNRPAVTPEMIEEYKKKQEGKKKSE